MPMIRMPSVEPISEPSSCAGRDRGACWNVIELEIAFCANTAGGLKLTAVSINNSAVNSNIITTSALLILILFHYNRCMCKLLTMIFKRFGVIDDALSFSMIRSASLKSTRQIRDDLYLFALVLYNPPVIILTCVASPRHAESLY